MRVAHSYAPYGSEVVKSTLGNCATTAIGLVPGAACSIDVLFTVCTARVSPEAVTVTVCVTLPTDGAAAAAATLPFCGASCCPCAPSTPGANKRAIKIAHELLLPI